MPQNVDIVRRLYTVAEGSTFDAGEIASLFAADGYMRDMATGTFFRGQAIAECIGGLLKALPDLHREPVQVYSVDDVVVVELTMKGTHTGALPLASGTLGPTGRAIDVPSCDVFRLQGGKIVSFHCYNEASVMQEQLGVGSN
ncbi:Ketosteroid isomerase-related protein [Sphingomonas guangdongensis]|uniref:Ketosteroid isomerase-related protein n=1 Tax=Sphingomonas guangdongensis TaxID=1141890 RepID=A0A285QYX4_9SPHN|nr:nuclear transport factor 2 family protein [Sphingomonas guangdongensis]SOB87113.1 Ketosteroid isomerase-related protein [Sphingomonas guangdongensis]